MSVQAIEKVFVDADDEIIFVVEKILKAPTNKVIVVIPASSTIESSAISMKLLSRQIVDSNKNIVVVSDNPVAKNLAAKAHLVVRDKVSMVDRGAWEESAKLKVELLEHKNNLKEELLNARKPEVIEEEPKIEEPEVETTEKATEVNDLPDEEELFAEKPRLDGKEMEIAGIAIIAGGDIVAHQNAAIASATPLVNPEIPDETEVETPPAEKSKVVPEPKPEKSEVAERRVKQNEPKGRFDKKKLKKYGIIGGIILLLSFGAFVALSLFVLPSVVIDVNFNQSEGEFNKTVTVSTKATAVDPENLIVPGTQITLEETTSGDGTATGKKETGEFAQGVIDIRNKSTESAVNLASGQVVTDISSNKQYTITKNISIPADEYERDVPIKAKEFGEDYNIEDEQSTFKVQGFTTEQLVGFGFRDITGGTTEEIVIVTEEDVAKVKSELDKTMKANLTNNLNNQVGQGEVLLEGSEVFEQVSFNQSVKTGEEAESFTAELRMKVTATKVSETDVEELSAEIIKDSEKASEEAEIMVGDFEIRNVKVSNGTTTFQLSATGEVNENLDMEEQKNVIGGMSISDAETYLESLDQINEVIITYSPSYIPESLRKIPSNPAKIQFE